MQAWDWPYFFLAGLSALCILGLSNQYHEPSNHKTYKHKMLFLLLPLDLLGLEKCLSGFLFSSKKCVHSFQ